MPKAGPIRIEIAAYDPRWPELFRRERDRIRAALGQQALRVEHAGSTAVPGLAAKPVIDILLALQDSADEDAYAPALASAGYRLALREPEWNQHRLFRGVDARAVNLHVFSLGCPEIERMLTFRDWLRHNPADRELYERVKIDLAQKEWAAVDDYAKAKTAVVAEIMARASLAARASD